VLESPDEVQPLVRSLNDLLARLGDAFDTQRVSPRMPRTNCAHRSPR